MLADIMFRLLPATVNLKDNYMASRLSSLKAAQREPWETGSIAMSYTPCGQTDFWFIL